MQESNEVPKYKFQKYFNKQQVLWNYSVQSEGDYFESGYIGLPDLTYCLAPSHKYQTSYTWIT
jgi:hypothetical protein